MAITLELPQDAEATLNALSAEERSALLRRVNEYAVAAIQHEIIAPLPELPQAEENETEDEKQERLRETFMKLMGRGVIINPPPPGKSWSQMEGFD